MSKIHEALKRAEQEQGLDPTPSVAAAAVATTAPVPVAPREVPQAAANTLATAVAEAPRFDGPLTSEMIRERCNRTDWKLNPEHLLSFNGAGQPAVGTEEFRTLRSRLYQVRTKQPLTTVLITSALAGEGKTFVASNLAQTMVQHRSRRVLLIDGDLRRPRLHEVLGTRNTPGLSEYLCGSEDELAILQRGSDNFFFIPGGRTATNAAELIANGQFKNLVERLAPAFDWIIVDSPPAMLVSDASLIADACDGVVLVVRAGETPVDVAQKARQEFQQKRLLGVALNQVDVSAGYSSYYYYTYGSHSTGD